MPLFLQGLVIGFSIAAPVGPIGLLCLQRSLAHGRLAGFVSGLGAATADAVYGALAAFGLGVVAQSMIGQVFWLRLAGGLFLLYLGITTCRAAAPTGAAKAADSSRLSLAFASTFGLTLTNPLTILAFVGIFAGVGADSLGQGPRAAGWLVAGVFVGSAAWWLFLATAAGWLRPRLQAGGMRRVNLAAGAVIGGFGVWQLAGLALGAN
jgi:threonine/homoserine/homoserine lactone efflux protein